MKPSVHHSKKTKTRRSGLNRRWINGSYNGPERRSGTDRREDGARQKRSGHNRLFVPLEEKLEELDSEKKASCAVHHTRKDPVNKKMAGASNVR